MRQISKPTTSAGLLLPVWRFLGTNFADRKPTICAMASMNCESAWVRSTTAFSTFFYGQTVSVISHGLTKEAAVPAADIKRAISRKAAFAANPTAHTFKGEIHDA
jgi:hypothetical protein